MIHGAGEVHATPERQHLGGLVAGPRCLAEVAYFLLLQLWPSSPDIAFGVRPIVAVEGQTEITPERGTVGHDSGAKLIERLPKALARPLPWTDRMIPEIGK